MILMLDLKKLTAVLLAFVMTIGIFSAVPFEVSAAEAGQSVGDERFGNFNYRYIDDETAEITGVYNRNVTELEIPSSINNHIVTKIKLYFCNKVTSVNIPDTVKYLDSYAFGDWQKLQNIILPDSVIEIGNHSFDCCYALQTVFIPASVKKIGSEVFSSSYVSQIYYGGSEADWANIQIDDNNEELFDADIHYGCSISPDGFWFEKLEDNTYAVADYQGTASSVVIPSAYNGSAVSFIALIMLSATIQISKASSFPTALKLSEAVRFTVVLP